MSANVPLKTAFDELAATVLVLSEAVASLSQPVELTAEEKAAIQTVINLVQRIVNP